jgi:hypothetical protein
MVALSQSALSTTERDSTVNIIHSLVSVSSMKEKRIMEDQPTVETPEAATGVPTYEAPEVLSIEPLAGHLHHHGSGDLFE